MEWKHVLAYMTGSVDQQLLLRNEYLVTENRILRQQITGRVQLSDGKPSMRPHWLGRARADLTRAAITPELCAIPVGDTVIALDAAGTRRWEARLPRIGDEPWRVRATRLWGRSRWLPTGELVLD